MDLEIGLAGLGCVLGAAGHATIGARWALPRIAEHGLPGTALGPPAATAHAVRVTWHAVTIFLLAFGVLLLTIAGADDLDLQPFVLRWLAAIFVVTTAMFAWVLGPRLRTILRSPVPLFVVVAALCWGAA